MKAKTKIDGDESEEEEDDKEKGDEKANTSNSETRRCVTVSANVGRARILDRWSGQRGESAKALNDSKAARCQLQHHNRTMQSRGLYLAPLQIRARTVFRLKHGHGVAAKKKKCRKDNNKNAVWCNYQCAIERAPEMYARIIL